MNCFGTIYCNMVLAKIEMNNEFSKKNICVLLDAVRTSFSRILQKLSFCSTKVL